MSRNVAGEVRAEPRRDRQGQPFPGLDVEPDFGLRPGRARIPGAVLEVIEQAMRYRLNVSNSVRALTNRQRLRLNLLHGLAGGTRSSGGRTRHHRHRLPGGAIFPHEVGRMG